MDRPIVIVVADTGGAENWLRAIQAAAGPAVDCRAVQNLSAAPSNASVVVIDTCGGDPRHATPSSKFSPATVLALGPMTGADAVNPDPEGSGRFSGTIGSIVPLWHTEWYMSLRKALAAGQLGALRRISLTCGPATGGALADCNSTICRAIMLPTGFGAGASIEWNSGVLTSDGFLAEGMISGTGTTVSLGSDKAGSSVTAIIEGSTGRATIELDQGAARVVISTDCGESVELFHGRFDLFAGAARQIVLSALTGRPRMMPGSAGDAFRKSVDGLARECGISSGTGSSFTPNAFRAWDGSRPEVKIFVEGRCNMACPFCFSPKVTPPADTVEGFVRQFTDLKSHGFTAVILSGGEPTINRELSRIVKAARDAGIDDVTLETNAVLVDESLAVELAAAGLRRALVSLHSVDPVVSAAMTGASGLLPRTMAGMSFLLKAGIRVSVNFVITALNWKDLPSTARWVSQLVPRPELMVISSMAVTGDGAGRPDLLAQVSDSVPAIREAVHVLREAGITPVIPGQCGLPPCVLPDMPELFFADASQQENSDWVACAIEGRFHAPGCESCRCRRGCYGIWIAYAERFGTAEFKPLP